MKRYSFLGFRLAFWEVEPPAEPPPCRGLAGRRAEFQVGK